MTLNLISHFWNGMNGDEVEEIFQTGDTLLAVTRDVWAHIVKPKAMEGSVVLLDVEGTNLGNDSLTDHLSMFTALISSGLTVMVQTVFRNKNLDFLFRVSRLSDVIFRNGSHERFANLRVLFRGHLCPPNGRRLEDYTRYSVVGPFSGANAHKNEIGRIIAKHFLRNKISVSQVPFIGDRGLFSDNERLNHSDYWKVMKNVAEEFLEFPIKTSFEGTPMDGLALANLAKHLVNTMNKNAWPDFGNVYVMFERNICKRHYGNLVKPLLSLKADEITSTMQTTLNKFKHKCALEGKIKAAEENFKSVAEAKKELEELDRKLKEAEDKRHRNKHFIIYLFYIHFFGNKFSILLHVNDLTPLLLQYFVCFVYRNTRKITKHVSIERELPHFYCFKLHKLIHKTRYRNHLKSQRIEKEKHETKLSKHVWNQKRKIENFRSDGPSSSKYQPAETENETALYA